jgi:hypothetical protein
VSVCMTSFGFDFLAFADVSVNHSISFFKQTTNFKMANVYRNSLRLALNALFYWDL